MKDGIASNRARQRSVAGRAAEDWVCDRLLEDGFEILGRNVRLGYLELDIVALEARVVIVIEVRFRGPGAFTTPLGSLGWHKLQRTRWAGQRLWDRRFRRDPRVDRLRFDLACVVAGANGFELEYLRAAF
ncbi:MAG TPA: YraN family protein [Polyangiaceae bacterium]|nr:YraN family protein [Polyangiaceae bacterium]